MSGLIGVPAQETARFTMFTSSLAQTSLSDDWDVYFRYGHAIGDNINACIDEMIRRDKDWFWLLGDDHAWSPELLWELLGETGRRDPERPAGCLVIVPLCLMRNPPYRPVIWKETMRAQQIAAWADEKGAALDSAMVRAAFGYLSDSERYERVELADHPDGGVIEVAAAGGAGMLIHRSVIDKLGSGWFDAGRGTSSMVGEDINFCEKARAAGFKIWCDLDSMLGHCATTVVWPVREHDGWTFGFSMMGGFKVTMPPGMQAYADEVGQ